MGQRSYETRTPRRAMAFFPAMCGLLALAGALPAAAVPIRTLLLGDSITFGTSSAPMGPGYADLLGSLLAGTHEIVNTGVSGTSTYSWAPSTPCEPCTETSLFAQLVSPEMPADVVTILLGTNDAFAYLPDKTPPDDYESFMREIIDELFVEGVGVVVLLTAPRSFPTPPIVSELLADYRTRILTICGDSEGVRCGPDLFTLLDATDFAPETVHPNRFGHEKIALAMRDTLISMPEPQTGTLVALGLALLGMRRPVRIPTEFAVPSEWNREIARGGSP